MAILMLLVKYQPCHWWSCFKNSDKNEMSFLYPDLRVANCEVGLTEQRPPGVA